MKSAQFLAALEDASRRGSSGSRRDRSWDTRRAPPRRRATQRSPCASASSATSGTTTSTSSSEASHPNIDIKEDIQGYADHHGNLAKHLATGAGADDIEAIEVGFIAQFTRDPAVLRQPQLLRREEPQEPLAVVEVAAVDCAERRPDRLRHRRRQPGDLLPRATCSRRPACRRTAAKVSALWPTWQKYIAAGMRYQEHAPKDTHFFDSAATSTTR